MASALENIEFASARRSRLDAAFTAWLLGAGDKKSWPAFCRYYGLIEDKAPEQTVPSKEETRDLYAWAEGVVAAVHGGKG
jgi:hypothetical protein